MDRTVLRIGRGTLEVGSTNKTIETLVANAFRLVSSKWYDTEDYMPNIYSDVIFGLNELRLRQEFVPAKITYSGERICFSYEGTILIRAYGGESTRVYPDTNEHYGAAAESVLSSITGLTHYLGIAGGLAAIGQLNLLAQNNRFLEIELVDKNSFQIVYDMLRLVQYDMIPTHKLARTEAFHALQNIEVIYPGMLKVKFSKEYMKVAIESVTSPGIYFIYLSNISRMPVFSSGSSNQIPEVWNGALPAYIDLENADRTAQLVRTIVENVAILDGSVVMFSHAFAYRFTLLQKNEGTVSVFSQVTGTKPDQELRPLDEVVRMEVQQRFLDSMVSNDALFRAKRMHM